MSIKIGGLASGIDTESIIKTLIDAKQVPITTLEDKVAEAEEKYTVWNEVDLRLNDMRFVSQQLNSYTVWNQKSATSSDETIFSAAAGLSSQAGTYSVQVSQLAQAQRIGSNGTVTAATADGDFTVGGETITVTNGDTLADIRDAINTAAENMDDDERVKSYVIGSTLVIEREKTGDTDITIADGTNNILQSLGIVDADGTTPSNELQTSEDLSATINGVSYSNSSNTGITDAVSGVTMNFFKETTGDGETMTVGNDTENIKTLIQDFVEKYNDAMDYAKAASAAKLENDGQGNENLSAYGLLQGDLLITQIQTKMRNILSSVETNPNIMDQDYNSFYTIGVWFDGQDNKLSIDEEKLDDALENHFDEVQDLFRAYPEDSSDGGVMRQIDSYLYGTLLDPVNGLVETRMETIEDNITKKEYEISDLYDALQDYEDSMWEHFAAMEEAVSNINSQWQYVSGSLGLG